MRKRILEEKYEIVAPVERLALAHFVFLANHYPYNGHDEDVKIAGALKVTIMLNGPLCIYITHFSAIQPDDFFHVYRFKGVALINKETKNIAGFFNFSKYSIAQQNYGYIFLKP